MGIFIWYQMFTVHHINLPDDTARARILWWVPAIPFLLFDIWFFGRHDVSAALETQFDGSSRHKRNLSRGLAMVWLAGLIAFMIFSRNALIATCHLPPPP